MTSPIKNARYNLRVFVGRGFSHDIGFVEAVRLQPLKYRFCICRGDAMRPNHANH
jgi:hypothetical protein